MRTPALRVKSALCLHGKYFPQPVTVCLSLIGLQGHVLRKMGFHADLLEPRWRSPELLPLHNLPGQPRPGHVPLEPLLPHIPLRRLPLRVLGVGYDQ